MPVKRGRFAARRKAVGFSQEQLTERVSVDRSTVVRWESGETEPLGILVLPRSARPRPPKLPSPAAASP
jgi:transcriptional regulator with XRE-family HTH domain